MSFSIHFTSYVLTCTLNSESCCHFFWQNFTRLQTRSRPSSHHSEVRILMQLCSTKDVPFHLCFGFFSYSVFSTDFFASFLKTIIIFLSSNFWEIVRWKSLFPVSMKVLLKAGNINKSFICSDSHVFWFPVMAQDSGRKSLICFFLKMCWNCKLRYKGSGIRRKKLPINRAAFATRIFSLQSKITLCRGSAAFLPEVLSTRKNQIFWS